MPGGFLEFLGRGAAGDKIFKNALGDQFDDARLGAFIVKVELTSERDALKIFLGGVIDHAHGAREDAEAEFLFQAFFLPGTACAEGGGASAEPVGKEGFEDLAGGDGFKKDWPGVLLDLGRFGERDESGAHVVDVGEDGFDGRKFFGRFLEVLHFVAEVFAIISLDFSGDAQERAGIPHADTRTFGVD